MEWDRWSVPAIGGVVIFWLLFAYYYVETVRMTGGYFVYTLDDAFIHAAVAEHIAADGVWSINDRGFAAVSTSILWPLLLAGVFRVGVHHLVPLAFNVVFATLSIVAVARMLDAEGVHPLVAGVTIVALVAFTPFVPVAFTGLEHHLHILLVLVFGYLAGIELTDRSALRSHQWPILVTGMALLTATRYEAILFVGIIGVMFVVGNRIRDALLVVISGATPLVTYGLYSMSRGGPFIPNPVRLKGNSEVLELGTLLVRAANHLEGTPHLLVLVGVAGALFVALALTDFWRPAPLMLGLFVGTTVAHLAVADTGWLYRYEAYLVAFGIVACVLGVHRAVAERPNGVTVQTPTTASTVAVVIAIGLVIATVASPMALRASDAHSATPQASENIHDQQYQMARFLETHYPDRSVAANDVGAINYYADVETVDLAGLGTNDVAFAMENQNFTTADVARLSSERNVQIAIVYDHWFRDGAFFPDSWTKVGEWTVQNNVILAGSTVSFYAVNGDPQELAENLCRFSPRLPPDVETDGPFTRMDTCHDPVPLDEMSGD